MNPEAMLLAADVPGWLLNVRDWWMLNWLWVVRAMVEIGVLAVVIYYAFQYLKRTRGWPVVAGFLSLLALCVLAIGVWPFPLLEVMHVSVENLLQHTAVSKL